MFAFRRTSAFCEDCDDEWHGRGALAAARRHADRHGHTTRGEVQHMYAYGPNAKERPNA